MCPRSQKLNSKITKDLMGPSHIYVFALTFDNGITEEYTYDVCLGDLSYPDPLEEFFSLPSVIEMMRESN